MSDRVPIRKLPTGVPGLDEVLGGGIPELSFNLIAGGPGCGKTTLGHQIMFANATPERAAIYFTIIGEPPIKMLRYQQQFSFFDPAKIDAAIRFVHLGEEARVGGLASVLERIEAEVEQSSPAFVFVDSFRSMLRRVLSESGGELQLQDFIQRLALHLTNCEATTFLLGEYGEAEQDTAVLTVADGILWLQQALDRNSVVRKLHVMKMRGQGQIPGLHTARIGDAGMSIFPRLLKPEAHPPGGRARDRRLSTGVPALDEMMHGGIPEGYSVLIAGPSGSGKTVLTNQFVVEGARRGEPGVVAVFEKRPEDYLELTPDGGEFAQMVKKGLIEMLYLRPLDLSIDETLLALRDAVRRTGAKRAVIDSLSGLELALAPTFREDFRESTYRMIGALTGSGVTVMATVELADSYTDLQFSPQRVAFLTDAIVMQRYVEMEGRLKRALSVVKLRSSPHSKDLREYEVTSGGLSIVGEAIRGYRGILTGSPSKPRTKRAGAQHESGKSRTTRG
jgi:circadian clock protein KaiC